MVKLAEAMNREYVRSQPRNYNDDLELDLVSKESRMEV